MLSQKYRIALQWQIGYRSHMKIEELTPEALKLPTRDRVLLASSLWDSIEDPYDLTVSLGDEEAIALAMKRDAEIESGEVKALSHTELMKRLDR